MVCTDFRFCRIARGVQANSITAGLLNNAFSIPPLTSGIVLVVILGLIIFGGVKRIAAWHNMLFRLWPLDMFLFRYDRIEHSSFTRSPCFNL